MVRFILIYFLLLAGLGCGICHAIPVPPSAATPSLQQIIDRTLTQDDVQQQALQSMQYDQTAVVDQLGDDDKITRHEILQMLVSPGENPGVKIVSVTGDHIPTDPDQAEAQAAGRDVESNKQTFTLRALVDRFQIILRGVESVEGQPAYVLAFSPKPDQPYRDETEKVVNQLQGQMWISVRTYHVLRTEAKLAHPVSIAWFLARIPTLDFTYSTHDVDTGFAPSQVRITLNVQAFFVGYHERQVIDMTNFRSRIPASAGTGASVEPAVVSHP